MEFRRFIIGVNIVEFRMLLVEWLFWCSSLVIKLKVEVIYIVFGVFWKLLEYVDLVGWSFCGVIFWSLFGNDLKILFLVKFFG